MSHLNINGVDKPLDHIRLNNVRSENLFDGIIAIDNRLFNWQGDLQENAAYAVSEYIPVEPSTSYTYHFYHNTAENRSTYSICEYDSNKNVILPLTLNQITENRDYNIVFTTSSNTAYIRINWKKSYDDMLMLNAGSTALPYQPYLITKEAWEARTRVILHGLTNPLCGIDTHKDTLDLSAGVLTRYVKKLVLTGDETWNRAGSSHGYFTNLPSVALNAGSSGIISSHYQPVMTGADGTIRIGNSKVETLIYDNYTSVTDWKAYLAAQYANGTPVTVWYVLATPETEQITVPSHLTGTVEGFLTQTGTPTPTNPIYPTANGTLEQGGTYSLDTGAYAIAWGRADTFTGTNSISARCYGLPVKSWEIDGNSQQSGVPDPDNPIMPTFCGVRTGNLLDTSTATLGKYINAQGDEIESTAPETIGRLNHTDYIEIQPNKDYTYHYKFRYGVANTIALCWFDASKNLISRDTKDVGQSQKEYILTGTSPANAAFCIINFTGYLPNESMELSFNIGSTALQYEPFGYKLPITSAGQTQTVFLGQVPTVRRIKKIDLGTKTWSKTASGNFIASLNDGVVVGNAQVGFAYCSHFIVVSANSYGSTPYSLCVSINSVSSVAINKTGYETLSETEFKDAMNGVYLWYALAEPTTGIVNEPLAKIGTYADTLTSEQAGITIQTADGNTTISVDTPLAPSKFEVKVHAKPI